MKKNSITVALVVKDEQDMLLPALKSVSWADEVLVVDTGSIDDTVKISKEFGARVVKYTSGKNYSDWRNKALKEVSTRWVFYLDADERVTKELKEEVVAIVNSDNDYAYYAIPRRNIVLGRELRHGGWWPDYVKRLYKKDSLKKWQGALHEEPVVDGPMGHLTAPLKHIKHETIFEMVEKTNKWSVYEAKLMFDAGHPPMNVSRFTSAMFREFWFRMVRKLAFLDGPIGIIFAIYQVFSRFVSYAKLWEMQLKANKK